MSKYFNSESKSQPAAGFAYTDQDYAQFDKLLPASGDPTRSMSTRKSNTKPVNEDAFAYTQQDMTAFEKLAGGSQYSKSSAKETISSDMVNKQRSGIRSSISSDRIRVVEFDKFNASERENSRHEMKIRFY